MKHEFKILVKSRVKTTALQLAKTHRPGWDVTSVSEEWMANLDMWLCRKIEKVLLKKETSTPALIKTSGLQSYAKRRAKELGVHKTIAVSSAHMANYFQRLLMDKMEGNIKSHRSSTKRIMDFH